YDRFPMPVDATVNRITGRAWRRINNCSLETDQAIQKGRLTDIGATNNGDPQSFVFAGRGVGREERGEIRIFLWGKGGDNGIHQVGDPTPMSSRNREEGVEAERVEVGY